MFRFRTRENAQRKYVDLIKCASARWPNWDPPRNFRVSIAASPLGLSPCVYAPPFPSPKQPGDFGIVNKKTGALVVEGNIYTHPDIAQIAQQYQPIQAAEVDHYQINSFDVRGLDVNAAVGA
jgi:hypothetical protein